LAIVFQRVKNKLKIMRRLLVMCFSLALMAGCVSQAKSDARAREAYVAGQRAGMAEEARANSVSVIGNVKNALIPWTEDLTLTRLLIAANYQGAKDPSQIIIFRNGKSPVYVPAKRLLGGYDVPLQAGDHVEIRP
jgi:hypothetical protein